MEKNILTHLKKPKIQERYNTGFSYHIHANSSLKMVELHWSSDTPMTSTLGNSFNCATLLPDSTQRQGTPPTALGSPTSWGVLPLIYCFFYCFECLFVWVFNSFLISLRHRKPVFPWGTAHHTEGCAAKLDTGQRGSIAKLDVP